MTRVCIVGATGRMGRSLLSEIQTSTLTLGAAVDRTAAVSDCHGAIGTTVLVDDLAAGMSGSNVYIDFTSPAATVNAARLAYQLRLPAVIGTTGLGPSELAVLEELATVAPVVVAANFSLGVAVLANLAERAVAALGPGWDVEIVESHHRHKVDAPSGTALALVAAVEAGRAELGPVVSGRSGAVGPRSLTEIGVHAVRGGDIVGEHTVYLIGSGERLELGHRATDRAIFARGALRAAAWVVDQPPGLYQLSDVLGLA